MVNLFFKNTKKTFLLILTLLFIQTLYSQNQNDKERVIQGKVTQLKAALSDVNIVNKNSKKGTRTDNQGNYSIKAKIGDQIEYSYIGFKTISIVVEDVTKVLNLEMVAIVNELEEVEVVADKKLGKVLETFNNKQKKFKTSKGTINPEAAGYSIGYVNGEELNLAAGSLARALIGRVAGLKVINGNLYLRGYSSINNNKQPIWDVDGMVYRSLPPINLTNIKDVYVLRSLAGTVKYGSEGAGGVIVVRTKNGSFADRDAKRKAIAEKYINKNYYKNDAVNTYRSYATGNKSIRDISGKVTYQGKALVDVNIINKNLGLGTKTNAQGNYIIKANKGDLIRFSYMGMKSVSIVTEDITSVLNIKMQEEEVKLEETVVKNISKNSKSLKLWKKKYRKLSTARGAINPETAGYSVGFFDASKVSNMYSNLTEALVGRLSGYYIFEGRPHFRRSDLTSGGPPAIWDVDGVVYTEDPPVIDLTQIKDVYVLKSLAGTNKYGGIGGGGVIVVRTKYASLKGDKRAKNDLASRFTNKNYYEADKTNVYKEALMTNPLWKELTEYRTKTKAFDYYTKNIKNQLEDYGSYIDIAKIFKAYYKDMGLVAQILNDLATMHYNNPEILKAVAYQMQEYNLKTEAILVYERVFKLRPKYAQSFRDLANAYKENRQYNKSWKLYMSYLVKGNDANDAGIGQILYNEMEWMFYNHLSPSTPNIRFVPNNKDKTAFTNDLRIVFEWNTSEAEFELEFVNPKRQVYVFEHSLEKNQDLINIEKLKGYSSKEFIIEDIDEFVEDGSQGEDWLVNLTYLGNKKADPTYLKVTKFYNWGKHNQYTKLNIYKLEKENKKVNLYLFNKKLFLALK